MIGQKNVTSRSCFIQLTGTIFQLNSRIKETNVLTKFHENRVFTCFDYIHIEKNAPPTGGHLHDDWAKIVTSRVFTRQNCPAHWRPYWAFDVTSTFHEDRTINVASIVFTNKCGRKDDGQRPVTKAHLSNQCAGKTDGQTDGRTDRKLPRPPGNHETNVLTKLHENENWAKNVTSRVLTCFHYIHIEKNAPPTGGHVFSLIWTIYVLVRHINKTNVLISLYDNWAKIVTSRVFTSFEIDRDFIGTKLLTKFHEDRTINVASRVFTNKC
ncbi:hypothetical protein DPMN_094958 [Dreissena polymorpha]|uniref:Uncharacterized protein n=1 Tax=Dreissena polymorpha TaxID=45954 RepID=A0A9D4R343_DREPO|nr:hypothetical protein DPMN_094958 [Dreissena polymorpha]